MKTLFGILIIIVGFIGGIVVAIMMLVTGIMDIIDMINTGVTFWGLFWAIVWISLREIVAGIIIWGSFIIGISLFKK